MSSCRIPITIKRRQGQSREGWSEGSQSAKVRADDKIARSDFEHPQDGPEGVSPRGAKHPRLADWKPCA